MSLGPMQRELYRLISQVLLLVLFLQTSGAAQLGAFGTERELVTAARIERLGLADRIVEPKPSLVQKAMAGTASTASAAWKAATNLGANAVEQVAAISRSLQDETPQWFEQIGDQDRRDTQPGVDPQAAVPSRAPPPSPPGLRLPQATVGVPGVSSVSSASAPGALVDLSQVPLVAGPNLISLPNQPPDPDPAVVLAPIAGQFAAAFAYDNCDAVDPWKVYDPADLPGSDLAAIDHTIGLWIDATAATTLPSDGSQPAMTPIQLCTGWNLIGYPLMQERPVPSALASIEGKYVRVFGFDINDIIDPWEVYDIAAPDWANDLTMMQPGRGYWVLATEDVILDYENQGVPPTVEIVSPAPREEIASILDVVGTVQSNLLDQWTLSYRESGTTLTDATWVDFATGDTPVTGAVLGQFDPTLLLNGMYDIRLQALDFQSQIVEDIVPVAVDGQRKVGAFTLSLLDLQVALSGLDIEIIRTYDSRDKKKRDFGLGWSLDIKQGSYENNIVPGDGWKIVNSQPPVVFPCVGGLETESHLTTVRLSDEEVYRFRLDVFDTGPNLGGCFGQVRFVFVDGPVPGTTLDILGNTDVLWGSGTDFLFDPITVDIYNPTDVRLTTRDGREFDFVLGQGVTRLRDTNGNEIEITPTSISHSSGVSISMIRDSEDRIIQITDPLGSTMSYQYDAAGDLVAYTDTGGNTTTYFYDGGHRLLDTFDPLGNRGIRSEYDENGRLVSTTDASGNTITLSHDPATRSEVVTNRLGFVTVLEYDERGNITREIDQLGKEITRTFDADDNVLSATDPLGRTTTFSYTPENDLASKTDPFGNVAAFTYDASGRLLTTTDARGNTTTNVYDLAGNLTQTTDALGNSTTFTYDAQGNLFTETDALGGVRTLEYDAAGNLVRQIDPLGAEVTYSHDANANQLTEVRQRTTPSATEILTTAYSYDANNQLIGITAPDGTETSVTVDALGRPTSVTEALGRLTRIEYDGLGRQTRTTHPDDTTDVNVYDDEGRITSQIDRAGRTTNFVYDPVGRLVSIGLPDATTSARAYDAAGQLITSTDQRGNVSTFAYDDAGRRTQVINSLGDTTTTAYDAVGNPVSVTDGRGNTTTFTYDALNRLVLTTLPDGTTSTRAYDPLGRPIAETDQAGATTQFGYDAAGRLTSVTDALGQVTSYTYDEVGNRLTQTDANGNTTTFAYDAVGQQSSRTLPSGAVETRTYNGDGTLTSRTDFLGRTTGFTYDVNARLVRRDHPDGTSVVWTYTPTGRMSSFTDTRGVTSFTYDVLDRVTSMTYPDGRRLDHAYDDAGNRTSLTATVGATVLATTFSNDALNRLSTVADSSGGVYTHGYSAVGNRTSLSYPNGVTTSTTFDSLNRLSLMTTAAGATTLQSYSFTLGPSGRRTRIDEADGSSRAYTYDAIYRLTQDRATDGAAALVYQQDFTYDAVGNRLSLTEDTGSGPVVTSYTYDSSDQLLTEGAISYGYDANGNQTSKSGIAAYAWDTEDRLTEVTLADGTLVRTFYDPDGNRVRTETTRPGGPTETINYLVDTSGDLSHTVVESDDAGNVLTHYVRGHELLSLWRPAAAERRYYHADGLGSVRLLTDGATAVTDTYTYTAFGVLLDHTGTDEQPYQFAGEPYDPNIAFYYNRARWLDASIGRFTSRDPFAGVITDPLSLHTYLYAAADPVNGVDPSGREYNFTSLKASIAIYGTLISTALANYQNALWRAAYVFPRVAGHRWVLQILRNARSFFGGQGRTVRVAFEEILQFSRGRLDLIFREAGRAKDVIVEAKNWNLDAFARLSRSVQDARIAELIAQAKRFKNPKEGVDTLIYAFSRLPQSAAGKVAMERINAVLASQGVKRITYGIEELLKQLDELL